MLGNITNAAINCAQSVLAPFAPEYDLSEEAALRISTGFGSGMGRLCEVCGALTGAFMVVGLKYGRTESDGTKYGPKTETTYRLVSELARRFRERNHSIYCRELVGHDLSIPEEREKAKAGRCFLLRLQQVHRGCSRDTGAGARESNDGKAQAIPALIDTFGEAQYNYL